MFNTNTIIRLLVGCLVLFTCMPIHECAHAWAAEKLGDSTARYQGRITLNPFAHLDLVGSLCLLIGSVTGVGFGWAKPVQINPRNFKNQKLGMGLTALAGPASNFLLAFILMIIFKIVLYVTAVSGSTGAAIMTMIIQQMVALNVGLAVFNFLPIPPLDGSKILLLVLPEKIYFKLLRYENIISIVLMVLIFTNLLDGPLFFLQDAAFSLLDFLTGFVDIIFKAVLR